MATTNFVDQTTVIEASWLNDVDYLLYDLLANPSTLAEFRTNAGLEIGADVQAYDADLAAIAALSHTDSNFIVGNGSAWTAETGSTARQSLLSTGTTGEALVWSGSDWASAAPYGVVQIVTETDTISNHQSTTSSIPLDASVPANTEGYAPVDGSANPLVATITPTNTSNKLFITTEIPVYLGSIATSVVALFQDATVDAIATSYFGAPAAPGVGILKLSHVMSAGTTSATTFKVRVGVSAGTLYLNGNTSIQLFGGTLKCTLTVMEIKSNG